MLDTHTSETRGAGCIAVRFRMRGPSYEVVERLLGAVRHTDLSLLQLLCDGDCVYPFGTPCEAHGESSWRAELYWHSSAPDSVWRLAVFAGLAELLLEMPEGVLVELGSPTDRPNRGDVQ